jgi:hypothetical protein
MGKGNRRGDPLFFSHHPEAHKSRIVDIKPKARNMTRLGGGKASKLPSRFIGSEVGNRALSGTIIPESEFRPLVQRLIKRGDIPEDFDAAVKRITELTNQLIPEHLSQASPEFEREMMTHGEHMGPLVAVKQKAGRCFDWTAVFVAMARGAGLDERTEGRPLLARIA